MLARIASLRNPTQALTLIPAYAVLASVAYKEQPAELNVQNSTLHAQACVVLAGIIRGECPTELNAQNSLFPTIKNYRDKKKRTHKKKEQEIEIKIWARGLHEIMRTRSVP